MFEFLSAGVLEVSLHCRSAVRVPSPTWSRARYYEDRCCRMLFKEYACLDETEKKSAPEYQSAKVPKEQLGQLRRATHLLQLYEEDEDVARVVSWHSPVCVRVRAGRL